VATIRRNERVGWEYGTLAAEVYDLDKPIGHSFGDVEYYRRHLAEVSGLILEPAAGTGRILIPLLESGLRVEGLDTSPEMLALCRQHCQERGLDPVLRQADMTTFVDAGAYSAVIIPAGSIALLDGRAATSEALAAFQRSLVPGGRLIVDVPAPQPVTGPEEMRYWRRDRYIWTLQTLHIEYNPATNQKTRFLRYDKWEDGQLIRTELQDFRLQHWSVAEFTLLLADAGFTNIAVAADYDDGRQPEADTDDWTFQAVTGA
jgi:SAM-dependent methyltransferase